MKVSEEKLSKDFWLLKAIETSYALPNYPTKEQFQKGYIFTNFVVQPIRNGIGIMNVNSFFRALFVNIMAGGDDDSQHLDFEAVDFTPGEMSITSAYQWIADPVNKIQFGQLILGHGEVDDFIHVSQIRMGKPNQECLIYKKAGGYSVYKGGPVRVLDY